LYKVLELASAPSDGGTHGMRGAGRLPITLATPTPYSPRVERQASNGRTLTSRRLGGRAYWAIFKN